MQRDPTVPKMASDPNPCLVSAKLKRLNAIVEYIQETQPSTLNLQGSNIDNDDLQSLAQYLPGSHVTELILKRNNLTNGMKHLADVLPKTEIKKLDVSYCELVNQDLFGIMEVLKESKITQLYVESNEMDILGAEEQARLVELMISSHLTVFGLIWYSPEYWENDALFCQTLPRTSITNFEKFYGPTAGILSSLFSNLGQSSLKYMSINDNEDNLNSSVLTELSHNLKNSKLETLELFSDNIDDHKLNILVEGLVDCNVVDLDLSNNKIRGSATLGLRLKDTRIQKLSLAFNRMDQYGLFTSPDFLRSSSVTSLNLSDCHLDEEHVRMIIQSVRFSKVTDLDLSCNNLSDVSISEFARAVKDTILEKVSFKGNNLSPDAFIALAECIKASKLTHLDISSCLKYPNAETLFPVFLGEVKDTAVDSVKFGNIELYESGAESLAFHLSKITFSHLDLSWNKIRNGVISLAEHLKFSHLTHLCLLHNEISDEGAKALAKHLQETHLIELDLSHNLITNRGAEDLAACLKDSSLLRLKLSVNEIENVGIDALARGAENTFITTLDVSNNPGDSFLLVDTTLWQNKTAAHRLVSMFKLIAPHTFGDGFHFDRNNSDQNGETFLENCLELSMNFLQKPSAFSVLKEAEATSFSKEEITLLMSSEFPKQFSDFIARRVDADVTRHVNLLKSAEYKGLNKVVELLLLNRPSYMIDENQGILHPYVYLLLNKYNQPLFNLAVEPDAGTRIIDYFTERSDIEGAADAIRVVNGKLKR